MKFKGRIWILDDDDINTDVIYPGKYTYELFSDEEMAEHALEDFNPSFAGEVGDGDILIAGKNFGCGSSREQAVTCLKYAGVKAIVAESFARIYYRNAINQALCAFVCPEASRYARDNREKLEHTLAELDAEKGKLSIGQKAFDFSPLEGKALEIFEAGGLVPFTRKRLAESGK